MMAEGGGRGMRRGRQHYLFPPHNTSSNNTVTSQGLISYNRTIIRVVIRSAFELNWHNFNQIHLEFKEQI
jgi:hypothetical protein